MPDRADIASPITAAGTGVTVAVRPTPKASATRVKGLARDADGRGRVEASVTAAPEKGRANVQLINLPAREWRLAKSSIRISAGPPPRLEKWMKTRKGNSDKRGAGHD